ncbi:MAG: hypothetical protein AB1796_03300 [Bacillota bacterium]
MSYPFQTGFLWFVIVSSVIVLFGYEIWNIVTVSIWWKNFSKGKTEARDV